MKKHMDFTLNKYNDLCKAINQSKYSTTTLKNYLCQKYFRIDDLVIIMRHDVDRSPQRAIDTARVEYEHGIEATYYFRMSTFIYSAIDKIRSYGHEIGLHYETLDTCNGNVEEAIKLLKTQLHSVRNKYEIKTLCAHGNPLTKFDNKSIWQHIAFEELAVIGEAFHICRVVFEFAPRTDGSITHTIELSKHISKYLRYQMILAPKLEEDSLGIDNSFPFGVLRLKYCKFTMIQIIKRKLVPWFPVVPLIHISYGIKVIQKIIQLDKTLRIDIIHAHGIGSGIAATIAGWITNKPVIWMLHGTCLAACPSNSFRQL